MLPRAGFTAYIRSRSGGDIALATFGTAVGLWLCARLVLIAGIRDSLGGVLAGTVAALLLMGCWSVVVWTWFTRHRA